MNPKYLLKIFLVLILSFSTGCLFGIKKNPDVVQEEGPNENLSVLDETRLKQGGKLFISPFKPGPNVTATEKLDRLALFIVKGMTDTLKGNQSSLEVVNSDQINDADLVITGRVTRLNRIGGIKSWIPGNKKLSFGVQGQMTDKNTGQLVLRFSRERTLRATTNSQESAAYDIGREIGLFISSTLIVKPF